MVLRRLWVLGILAWLALAAAQPADASYRETEGGEAFYALLEERGADVYAAAKESSSVGGLAAELLQELYEALPPDGEAEDGSSTSADDVCGFVAGTGGKARIDGGGELAPFWTAPGFFQTPDQIDATWFQGELGEPFRSDIAIIDEFDLDRLASRLEDLAPADLDTVRAVLEAGRVTTTSGSLEVKHGHLVLHHLLMILAHGGIRSLDLVVPSDGGSALLTVVGHAQDPVRVHLFPIEFDGLKGLQDALGAIGGFTDPVAVVTSWGITGCRLAEAYTEDALAPHAAAGATFETIVELAYDVLYAIANAASGDERDEFLADVCATLLPNDDCGVPEVRAFVATIVALVEFERLAEEEVVDRATEAWGRSDVGFFASAGNERLPFAMPPASFDGVVAVAACSPSSGVNRAWFSNVGDVDVVRGHEVIAIGAWFAAPDLAHAPIGLGYWGTSFAAPLAAVVSGPPANPGDTWHVPDVERLCRPFAR
jgi:hypothetical protein